MTINFGIRLDGMVFCKLLGLRFFFFPLVTWRLQVALRKIAWDDLN